MIIIQLKNIQMLKDLFLRMKKAKRFLSEAQLLCTAHQKRTLLDTRIDAGKHGFFITWRL